MVIIETFNDSGMSSSQLLAAVAAGNFKVVRASLEAGVPADGRDKKGNTALILAAERSHVSIAGMLIGYGADVNAKNSAGRTPLDAAVGQNVEMNDLLLESGADPLGMISREGDKLLAVRAAMHGVDAAVSGLLGRDVSPNTTDDNAATLLVLAAAGGHIQAVETLLKAGADVHQRDKDARTPLRAAMQANSLECVTLLLAAGADPGLGDLYGTPSTTDHGFSQQCDPAIAAAIEKACQKFLLIHAAMDGDENKVAEFLSGGEPVNVFNHDGVTALTCACNQKHPNVVRLLLEHGADPNLATTKDQTPIGLSISKGDAECVKILLKAGAAPGPFDLHEACRKKHAAVVRILLDNGADPNIATKEGQAPIGLSIANGDTECVTMLLKAGAVPGPFALHAACGKKYADVAKVLLDNGADPNITVRSTKYFPEPADFYISMLGVHADDYPLHTAIKNRDIALAKVLAKAGARTVTKDAGGVTALERGRECGSDAVWEIIKARYEEEIEALATSAVTLDEHTTPLRTLKFKPQGPG